MDDDDSPSRSKARARPGDRERERNLDRPRSPPPSRTEVAAETRQEQFPLPKRLPTPPGLNDEPAMAMLRLPAPSDPPPPQALPPPQSLNILSPDTNPLGSRKRTFDDELKPPAFKAGPGRLLSGEVLPEWVVQTGQDECPWVATDSADVAHPSVRYVSCCNLYPSCLTFAASTRKSLIFTNTCALARLNTGSGDGS